MTVEELIQAYNELVEVTNALMQENEAMKETLQEQSTPEYNVGFINHG